MMGDMEIPDELIDQLLGEYQGPEQLTGPDGLINQLRRRLIEQVMQECNHVLIKAAERLGLNRNTLTKKLASFQQTANDNGTAPDGEVP